LLGYKVDIACYSQYLSLRDENHYKGLFNFFKVKAKIDYNQFDFFVNKRVEELGDTRVLARQLLEDKVQGGTGRPSDLKRILLIDEVDVFFSDHFLGQIYYPLVSIHDDDFRGLLMEIWNNRENYLKDKERTTEAMANHPLMNKFLEKYPNVKRFLKNTL